MTDKSLQERYDDALQVVSWQARRIEALESVIEAAAQMLKFPAQERIEEREPAPIQWVQVTEVERDEFYSKTSREYRPMWRLRTSDGRKVNLFDHSDPLRDQSPLLKASGYNPVFREMDKGQIDLWNVSPINIDLIADGSFWKVVKIKPAPDGASPDLAGDSDLDELEPQRPRRGLGSGSFYTEIDLKEQIWDAKRAAGHYDDVLGPLKNNDLSDLADSEDESNQ